MPCRCAPAPNPAPLFFVENDFGPLGRGFIECDRDTNSRAEIVRLIRSGGIQPVKILEIDEDSGSCRDVTDELVAEARTEREPRSLSEIADELRGMLIDHERDTRKHSVFGW